VNAWRIPLSKEAMPDFRFGLLTDLSARRLNVRFHQQRTFAGASGMSALGQAELCLEVDTPQDNAGRSAFELPCREFASGTLFNPVAQPHELCLTLVRPGPRHAFQIIHGGS
jgi:hypothetical protein